MATTKMTPIIRRRHLEADVTGMTNISESYLWKISNEALPTAATTMRA